ncbi:MAG: class F sortase [Candidatus Saccharimonadales bacterium]
MGAGNDLVVQSKLSPLQSETVISLVLILLTVVVLGYLPSPNTTSEATAPTPLTYSTDRPSEERPTKDRYQWRGGAADPKYIELPTIKSEGFIQPVGVDQYEQVAVPDNIHLAGWFSESVRPGKPGLSIIDGHVDGRSSDGIFKRLAQLAVGDNYNIELGDGRKVSFKVTAVQTVATHAAADVLFSQSPGIKRQLNLITCGGSFDSGAREYEQRVIVSSEAQL